MWNQFSSVLVIKQHFNDIKPKFVLRDSASRLTKFTRFKEVCSNINSFFCAKNRIEFSVREPVSLVNVEERLVLVLLNE